jgi:hypothetical protein
MKLPEGLSCRHSNPIRYIVSEASHPVISATAARSPRGLMGIHQVFIILINPLNTNTYDHIVNVSQLIGIGEAVADLALPHHQDIRFTYRRRFGSLSCVRHSFRGKLTSTTSPIGITSTTELSVLHPATSPSAPRPGRSGLHPYPPEPGVALRSLVRCNEPIRDTSYSLLLLFPC